MERDVSGLFKNSMEKIRAVLDKPGRDLVWLYFTTQGTYFDGLPGYFQPSDLSVRGRGPATRINVPAPKGLHGDNIADLVYMIIRDGFDLGGFVIGPGIEAKA